MPRRKAPKTKKSVSKRFKITATGKVLRHHGGKRHLMGSKSGKRRRYLGKAAVVHETDAYRVTQALPFDHRS
jgi:large subunit ribosomal protein L35